MMRQSRKAGKANGGKVRGVYSLQHDVVWKDAWAITKALILKIREEIQKHNGEFFMVSIPSPEEVHEDTKLKIVKEYPQARDWDFNKPDKILSEFAFRNKIHCLNLKPGFKKYAAITSSDLYLNRNDHWNTAGHNLAAKLIYEKLLQLELFD